MLRSSIAFIVALYAIGFALAALTAVRWPSLLLVATLLGESGSAIDQVQGLISWRELGLTYGLVYLLAAFFFYTSSTLIGRAGRGSVVCYSLGAILGFTPFLLFDFEAGWWKNPDGFEQFVLFSAVFTLILFSSVLELSRDKKSTIAHKAGQASQGELVLDQKVVPVVVTAQSPVASPQKPARRRPVPAAIARQRASFAAHGRRARLRQSR